MKLTGEVNWGSLRLMALLIPIPTDVLRSNIITLIHTHVTRYTASGSKYTTPCRLL